MILLSLASATAACNVYEDSHQKLDLYPLSIAAHASANSDLCPAIPEYHYQTFNTLISF